MAPETRSRGVAPPSRVYHSSPVLQQVQFPSRRKKMRTYGRQVTERMRQQTLTQIEFISSFDGGGGGGGGGDVIVLTDSEAETDNKENTSPKPSAGLQSNQRNNRMEHNQRSPGQECDGAARSHAGRSKRPVPAPATKALKSKRRRTLGDDSGAKQVGGDKYTRRKTLGDSPASPRLNTQTLTQFLGNRTLIADSDDDDDGLTAGIENDTEDGFLDWLGVQCSPSLGRSKTTPQPLPTTNARSGVPTSVRAPLAPVSTREESVIPQTPVKRISSIRFAVPLQGVSGGLASRIERYEPPNVLVSPLQNRSSPAARLPPELTGTPRQPGTTFARCLAAATPGKTGKGAPSTSNGAPFPTTDERALQEIPDSDDEDAVLEQESVQGDDLGEEAEDDVCYAAGVETQLAMHALASRGEEPLGIRRCLDAVQPSSVKSALPHRTSRTGPGTSASVSTTTSEPPSPGTPTPLRSAKPQPQPQPARQMRQPLYLPPSSPIYSQPLESQRVPISVLQLLPPHTARSDVLLPVRDQSLAALLAGHVVHLQTPFKIPDQVVRFWLLDGSRLRYMACVEPPGEAMPGSGGWRYYVKQVYELNNPVDEDDMREEGWVEAPIAKYVYLPPAVVGQLLWNLRHALFDDLAVCQGGDALPSLTGDGSSSFVRQQRQPHIRSREAPAANSPTISQQVAAQIHSDIAQSTQFISSTQDDDDDDEDEGGNGGLGHNADELPHSALPSQPLAAAISSPPHLIPGPLDGRCPSTKPLPPRPSQATTVSQSSTPEKHCSHRSSLDVTSLPISLGHHHSADSSSLPSAPSVSTSQLLSKSQLLSESLVRDHSPPPMVLASAPEIWDSDDDDVPL